MEKIVSHEIVLHEKQKVKHEKRKKKKEKLV